MGTKPSAPVSSSFTNSPARVTPEMRPLNVAPTRSASQWATSRSMVSRSAAMARRSAAEIFAAISGSSASMPSGRPPGAELQGAHQRAMDDQVGVAADRRGEMGVAAEVEAEMADVLRAVFGLRLGAQHHLVQQGPVLALADMLEEPVELRRPQVAALGQRHLDRLEEVAQRLRAWPSRACRGCDRPAAICAPPASRPRRRSPGS